MKAQVLVTVAEYLNTSFDDGDREYVDGTIVERNVGEVEHSDLQTAIALYLRSNYKEIWTGVEVRVQVKPTRFRIPDICVMVGSKPKERIINTSPLLVVEVLSLDDRAHELQQKIDDYLAFGVKYVWVVNPETRRGYIYIPQGMHEATDGVLRTENPRIEVPLSALF